MKSFKKSLKIVENESPNSKKYSDANLNQSKLNESNDVKQEPNACAKIFDDNSVNGHKLDCSDRQLSTMPSKNSVIKKMKKITKSVQELFQATKESEFHL